MKLLIFYTLLLIDFHILLIILPIPICIRQPLFLNDSSRRPAQRKNKFSGQGHFQEGMVDVSESVLCRSAGTLERNEIFAKAIQFRGKCLQPQATRTRKG